MPIKAVRVGGCVPKHVNQGQEKTSDTAEWLRELALVNPLLKCGLHHLLAL